MITPTNNHKSRIPSSRALVFRYNMSHTLSSELFPLSSHILEHGLVYKPSLTSISVRRFILCPKAQTRSPWRTRHSKFLTKLSRYSKFQAELSRYRTSKLHALVSELSEPMGNDFTYGRGFVSMHRAIVQSHKATGLVRKPCDSLHTFL